jgi:hypothetical protein
MSYRRNRQYFTLEHINNKVEKKEEQIADIEDLYNKLQKTKNDKRILLLNKFLESNTKFDDEEYTLLSDIRKKFKQYCYDLDKNNLNNMCYTLSKEDIINYNDNLPVNGKFKIKYYSFCKSCNQRYRYGCCDENNRLNRSSKEIILYMKLRN